MLEADESRGCVMVAWANMLIPYMSQLKVLDIACTAVFEAVVIFAFVDHAYQGRVTVLRIIIESSSSRNFVPRK